MSYRQFKWYVEDRGIPLRELRCDDAPPTERVEGLLNLLSEDKYEQFVTRLTAERN